MHWRLGETRITILYVVVRFLTIMWALLGHAPETKGTSIGIPARSDFPDGCCLQLSYGLSAEYSKSTAEDSAEKVDADRQIYAKYYVSQIMQLGEEGIRDACSKVRLYIISSELCYLKGQPLVREHRDGRAQLVRP